MSYSEYNSLSYVKAINHDTVVAYSVNLLSVFKSFTDVERLVSLIYAQVGVVGYEKCQNERYKILEEKIAS